MTHVINGFILSVLVVISVMMLAGCGSKGIPELTGSTNPVDMTVYGCASAVQGGQQIWVCP